MQRLISFCLILTVGLVLTACDQTSSEPQTSTPDWLLTQAPSNSVDVAAAKRSVTEGQTIVIRGRIGGSANPITLESGVLLLMDPAIPPCSDNPSDACVIPWDYCCETPDTKIANTATIQLRDASGTPIALTPTDLAPLDTLIIIGTVGPRPNKETLMIYATNIYKEPGA